MTTSLTQTPEFPDNSTIYPFVMILDIAPLLEAWFESTQKLKRVAIIGKVGSSPELLGWLETNQVQYDWISAGSNEFNLDVYDALFFRAEDFHLATSFFPDTDQWTKTGRYYVIPGEDPEFFAQNGCGYVKHYIARLYRHEEKILSLYEDSCMRRIIKDGYLRELRDCVGKIEALLNDDYGVKMLLRTWVWHFDNIYESGSAIVTLSDRYSIKTTCIKGLENQFIIILFLLKYAGHNIDSIIDKNLIPLSENCKRNSFFYFDKENDFKVSEGEVVIDAGIHFGGTPIEFAKATGSRGKVIAFEPNAENYIEAKKNTAEYENIVIVNEALGDFQGPVFMAPAGAGTTIGNHGTISVQQNTIDAYVDQHSLMKVDLIKMDIEGSEVQAINGAANTIKKFRPKLAIAAYHKWEDVVDLGELIRSINPDYKMFINDNYNNHYWIKTTIYAV
jgi:FkbM family methyltransferase